MDEKSNLKDDLIAEIKQESESLDMTPLTSFKSILRQALGYDDLTPIDLTRHISVALRSSTGSNAIAEREAGSDILRFFAGGGYSAVSLKVSIVPVQEGTGDPSPENIRPITGWTAVKVYQAAEYDEEAEPVIEVALGDEAGTVYGGTLDVITGVLTVTHLGIDMGGLSWAVYSSADRKYMGYLSSYPQGGADAAKQMCSIYKVTNNGPGTLADLTCRYYPSQKRLYIRDSQIESADDVATALDGQIFVLDLIEPVTYQLDPEELSTLTGENNIWADCGPVESITY